MSNQTTLFHGGAYEITKAREPQAGLVIQVFDMEEDASSVAPMTPDEWDAFVAAGSAALGRTPSDLANRALSVALRIDPYDNTESCTIAIEDTAEIAAILREVAAREQGATVPRAGVEALRDTILGWEKACAKSEYDDGRAAAILDCVGVIDTMLGTKEPCHADD